MNVKQSEMKRISVYTISAVLLAVSGITSCAKTTKGKMTNEWKITSFENTETYVNSMGSKQTSIYSMTDMVVTDKTILEPVAGSSSTSSETGTVNKHELTIKKDGTWSWTVDVSFVDGNKTRNESVVRSGTWSFIGKTEGDDFEKNERVLFNVLEMNGSEIETTNQQVTYNDSSKETYSTGKNTMVYTITESKNKKLEMELESKKVYSDDSNSTSLSVSQKIVLEKK